MFYLNNTTMYRESNGNVDMPSIECLNPMAGAPWVARFNKKITEPGSATWVEALFNHRPQTNDLRGVVDEYYNTQVQQKILSGFTYNDTPIWLSTENQQNYITAYTLGLDYLKVKGGTDSEPKYLELTSKEEIAEFVKALQIYIQECISWGWEKKDSVDYSVYGFNEHSN